MFAQRCPVCEGRGKVWLGFYDLSQTGPIGDGGTGIAQETCRACNGTGILWVGGDQFPQPQYSYRIIDQAGTIDSKCPNCGRACYFTYQQGGLIYCPACLPTEKGTGYTNPGTAWDGADVCCYGAWSSRCQ